MNDESLPKFPAQKKHWYTDLCARVSALETQVNGLLALAKVQAGWDSGKPAGFHEEDEAAKTAAKNQERRDATSAAAAGSMPERSGQISGQADDALRVLVRHFSALRLAWGVAYAQAGIDEIGRLRSRVAAMEQQQATAAEPVAFAVMSSADPPHRVGLHWEREWSERWATVKRPEFSSSLSVVPLYAAPPPARGWLTDEEREWLTHMAQQAADYERVAIREHDIEREVIVSRTRATLGSILSRNSAPRVKKPNEKHYHHITCSSRDADWLAALAAAGVEAE